jgi:hypothetical protein
LETTKMVMMKDLRVYVKPEAARHNGEHAVFYSRRKDGPYYCWRYEAGHWCVSRVHPSDLLVKELSITPWKAVPSALQASIDAYYVE